MTHQDLCERAVNWLTGSQRCNVAFSGIASAGEIPDAIGWSTSWKTHGSIIVECKVSRSDFRREIAKYKKRPERMGSYRYYFVPKGLLKPEDVEKIAPDHGLLYASGNRGWRVTIARAATLRENVDLHSENRLLQFAIVHMRSNLLSLGCSIDLNLLSKHPFTVHRYNTAHDRTLFDGAMHPGGYVQPGLVGLA